MLQESKLMVTFLPDPISLIFLELKLLSRAHIMPLIFLGHRMLRFSFN